MHKIRRALQIVLFGCLFFLFSLAHPGKAGESKPGEKIFAFSEKPKAIRKGDLVTVSFKPQAFCDVTVAVEGADEKILRFLASGVLGPNAPEPFAKNTLEQTLVWDSKDEQGRYVEDISQCSIRVSLGLKPRLEKSLMWSPYRRTDRMAPPLICARPEGVYVSDAGLKWGNSTTHLRLYDHDGNYVRTLYPFPAGKLDRVKGLKRRVFPQDGKSLPQKHGLGQTTLLTAGNLRFGQWPPQGGGRATALSVGKDTIYLTNHRINRINLDGSTLPRNSKPADGLSLSGPVTSIEVPNWRRGPEKTARIGPRSTALSPDGKWLYLTGYITVSRRGETLHAIYRMDPRGEKPPEVFLGKAGTRDAFGTDAAHFKVPSSITCDAKGRLYVADYGNDRVQVFKADGTFLASAAIEKPAQVRVHPETGEIYVFSWYFMQGYRRGPNLNEAFLTRLSPATASGKPLTVLARHSLGDVTSGNDAGRMAFAEVDFWSADGQVAPSPVIWFAATRFQYGTSFEFMNIKNNLAFQSIRLLEEKGGKLVKKFDFLDHVPKGLSSVPIDHRRRLHVNPHTGKVYLLQGTWGNDTCVRIDPVSGKVEPIHLPFGSLDLAFDLDGYAYLRGKDVVVRYDTQTWREIPFDYGEERSSVAFWESGRGASVISGLALPSNTFWRHGGMSVSPKGYVVASCGNMVQPTLRKGQKNLHVSKTYLPRMYPGRAKPGKHSYAVHVWDRHGKMVYEDAFPGMGMCDLVEMDRNDNLYVLSVADRFVDGKRWHNDVCGTLMKVKAQKARVLSTKKTSLPLASDQQPKRAPDMIDYQFGKQWVENAQWLYGGSGLDAMILDRPTRSCSCGANSRFALDYFGRTFVPEVDRFSVAVLDTNGNLILRVGRYGNVEDGRALDSKGGPEHTRSIGGDEVSIFHAQHVGIHTDRRLFLSDIGNERIASVQLGYHVSDRIFLGSRPEGETKTNAR